MVNTNSQVVVAFDFTASGKAALYRGIALAARAPSHVLHFVCVIEPHTAVPGIPATGKIDYLYAERVRDAIAEVVSQELRAMGATGRIHFFAHARIGKPAHEILDLAKDVGADLIIVGTKGLTGVERLVLGSVAEKVVREAGCAVEVARPKRYAHVQLLDIEDAKEHHAYAKPHRYSYENAQVQLRPTEWPLY